MMLHLLKQDFIFNHNFQEVQLSDKRNENMWSFSGSWLIDIELNFAVYTKMQKDGSLEHASSAEAHFSLDWYILAEWFKHQLHYQVLLVWFLQAWFCMIFIRLTYMHIKSLILVKPTSIHFLYRLIHRSGCGGAGAYPSGHRAKGGIHPGQVASSSQGHIETNETNNHTRSHSLLRTI